MGNFRRRSERAGDPETRDPPAAIEDYGVIGDGRSVALVSRLGSIDWLCWPRFDSPWIFGALLDPARGGCFRIRPAGQCRAQRRYLGATNVLETTFATDEGRVRLIDWMPVASEAEKAAELWPEHHLLRSLEGLEGRVAMDILYDPRPGYAFEVPRVADRGGLGLSCEGRQGHLTLRSDLALERAGAAWTARVHVSAGERRDWSLALSRVEPGVLPPLGETVAARLTQSLRWWSGWSGRCRYRGPFGDMVVRSALVLKLLAYAPSGAVIAAPTTSLPEHVGGSRNWDYRFCWLRDASMTLRALFGLGFDDEGLAFLSWMLHTTRLSWPELQVVYDVFGEPLIAERELDHLSGYRGSRPVRIGNAAAEQFQLDLFGEVAEAAFQAVLHGHRLDRSSGRMVSGLARTVCRCWRQPDHGIWEIRGAPAHYTHSKAMAWVALDRVIALRDQGAIRGVPEGLERERDAIRDAVERRGFSAALGSYTRVFDGNDVDASLLLLAIHGYADPRSDRMRSTRRRILERLGHGPGLLDRYVRGIDGLEGSEGAFGICSFWDAECRALEGDLDGAAAAIGSLLAKANDLGLYSEEIDRESGSALGNFPQAYTHIGLIHAALTLDRLSRGAAAASGPVGGP